MPRWSSINFSDASRNLIIEVAHFYEIIIIVLCFILFFIGFFLSNLLFNKYLNIYLLEGQIIEFIWTLWPALILIIIAIPSISLLWFYEEEKKYDITFKVNANQWYWTYELEFFSNKKIAKRFDRILLPINSLKKDSFRLLDTNISIILPVNSRILVFLTSFDVLHSWTLPRIGVKADAIPGRITKLIFNTLRPGVFFGQCSEICGAYHRYIPIKIEVVNLIDFLRWWS